MFERHLIWYGGYCNYSCTIVVTCSCSTSTGFILTYMEYLKILLKCHRADKVDFLCVYHDLLMFFSVCIMTY